MYLITYDISKDKTRAKVSKLLEDYGKRVQYSVFESDLTKEELDYILPILRSLIDPATDNIKIYNLCASCETKVLSIGVDKSYKIPDVMVI